MIEVKIGDVLVVSSDFGQTWTFLSLANTESKRVWIEGRMNAVKRKKSYCRLKLVRNGEIVGDGEE